MAKTTQYWFFDFECMITQPDLHHVPNLCICQSTNKETVTFRGKNCAKEFCTWIFSSCKNATFVAHNLGGYDGYFILNFLHENAIKPNLILRGGKILLLAVPGPKIRFIDSLNFFGMPLSSLPKTFGLLELKKGHFPYLFNTPENQTYVGKLPDLKYYDPLGRKQAAHRDLLQWYELETEHFRRDPTKVFDLQKELYEYCLSDVAILREACKQFQQEFKVATEIDPFESSITIASACNRVYRRNHMLQNSIAIIPPMGYDSPKKYSKESIAWLKWLSSERQVDIRHALNGGEIRVGNFYLDGYSDGPIAYEFYGCMYHGHQCIKTKSFSDFRELQKRYQRTMDRKKFLEAKGYSVVEIWECQFGVLKRNNAKLLSLFKTLNVQLRLKPRDAFLGGRCNAVKLLHTASVAELIRYLDIISLYPSVNATELYPIGHPRILTENFDSIERYFGLMKLRILPPRSLFHPVLGHRSHKKLLFALCWTCAELRQTKSCNHSDDERALTGTWCSPEVVKALEVGYKILHIFEIWHWEQASTTLFDKYVKTFLKLKQEASGWPMDCSTEAERQKYIADYYKSEGVVLEPSRIEKNSGRRAVAKTMLNSFWGYFGKRTNLKQTDYVSNYHQLTDFLTDDTLEISDLFFTENQSMAQISYKRHDEFMPVGATSNVVIAAFTTAHARLKLYSHLEKLGRKVLYFDIDSIFYVSKADDLDNEPTVGTGLGELKDEIADSYGPFARIEQFWSLGPKNYGYTVVKSDGMRKTDIKIKGVPLNMTTCERINKDTMLKLLHADDNEHVSYAQIAKNPRTLEIRSRVVRKVYQRVYDKRVLLDDLTTIPYGYIQ